MKKLLNIEKIKKPRKKIFLISRPFLNDTSGTGEQYATNLFYRSLSKEHDVSNVFKIGPVKPYHSIIGLVFYDYAYSLFALFLCKLKRINHAFFSSPHQGFFIYFFKLFGIKTIVYFQDCFFINNRFKNIFDRYSFYLYKKCFKYADHMVTSTRDNQELAEKYFLKKAYIVPLYLDDTFNVDFTEKKFAPNFGYIGGYQKGRKRTDLIISFLQGVSHKINFSFAGHIRGEFLEKLKTVANPNVFVNIVGPISFFDKVNFYKDTCFLFFPTSLEGFGLPILEALRTSTVPIIFKDAEIPNVLKTACIQVEKTEDIDGVLGAFENDQAYYAKTIREGHSYSLKFSENALIKFVNDVIS